MEQRMQKNYNPKEFEDRIYESWEDSGAFKAVVDENKKPFTIVMPPPNITGQLHMGHALDQTLQDVLTRWKRLQGYSALWLPGSDHASIATEVKVVERLRNEEGKEKEDIGREEFLKRAWGWKKIYGGKITEQCRKLGDSCDWERERFTMDEGCNKAVTEFFVRLYEKGLIYKGNRLINWCPTCGTSLSDAEVEHEDNQGKYWYFKYPFVDKVEGEIDGIVIATSRPETIFADVAIAVHPEDERYKNFIGKEVYIPTTDRKISIIADSYPDPEKGTGAVKITPAHDMNDFEVGERHNLEQPVCIDFAAKMTALAGKYQGFDRYDCRKAWVSELEQEGYLVKIEDIEIPIGGCYRCSTVVEPMLSEQWFVAMEKLAQPAIAAVKNGDCKHVPERFDKTYLHWLENIRDWCISRQLWWGHRIPAYYCEDCGEIIVAREFPKLCPNCASGNIKQDEDVLDTWFSSALWPFSTLGWPEETEDLKYFYPTDVLVTGYDIIFFWVVRMVFSAIEVTGETPFHHVFVHGLVRDEQGRKMSKSLNNGIDPLEIIDQYGADALRFMLITGVSPGNDMRFSKEKLESARNFANKLWNASRFLIMNIKPEMVDGNNAEKENSDIKIAKLVWEKKQNGDYKIKADLDGEILELNSEDMWIISRLNNAVAEITNNMEKYELGLAAGRIYELVWNEYCDWYIELVKPKLFSDDVKEKAVVLAVLTEVLKDILKLLHPFMPYITEEIWRYLPSGGDTKTDAEQNLLISSRWPEYSENEIFEADKNKVEKAMAIIKAIRNIRVEAGTVPSKKIKAIVLADDSYGNELQGIKKQIVVLANLSEISFICDKATLTGDMMSSVIEAAEVFVATDDLVDKKAEIERLEKEKKRLEDEVKRVEGKLSNQGFVSKAPEKLIEEEKQKLKTYSEMLNKTME
ncbi:MAG: valine--tRNA ligase, partial [Anaerovoracaceae bacterium]